MSAQQDWKDFYSEWKESSHTFDSLRFDMLKIRREAALERICARQQREIEALRNERDMYKGALDYACEDVKSQAAIIREQRDTIQELTV